MREPLPSPASREGREGFHLFPVPEAGRGEWRGGPADVFTSFERACAALDIEATGSAVLAFLERASVTGRRTSANPVRNAATSAAGSIATDLAGPFVGRFVRNLIGGLMR